MSENIMITPVKYIDIYIPKQTDALEVAYLMSQCKNKVWAIRGEYRVSAKSVLGLMSLDISETVTLAFETLEDYENVARKLVNWEVRK